MGKGGRPGTLGQVVFVAAAKGSFACVKTARCAETLSGTMEDVTHAASCCNIVLPGVCLNAMPITEL